MRFAAKQKVPSAWYEPEICSDCGTDRERQWVSTVIPRRAPVPAGWTVVKRLGDWKHIARPTNTVTLCMCDSA